jgi:hypothetical protein
MEELIFLLNFVVWKEWRTILWDADGFDGADVLSCPEKLGKVQIKEKIGCASRAVEYFPHIASKKKTTQATIDGAKSGDIR